jgi:CheY-like chemotaxis protein
MCASDEALRAQAAFVRALVDEVARYDPCDRRVAALHEQLGDELSRLAALAPGGQSQGDVVELTSPLDVLVVDDDDSARGAMAILLRGLGFPCRTAASPREALVEYENRPAAIVLSDWRMPEMSGLELCRAIKHRDPHVYVLLVTAHEDAGLLNEVRGGVDDFLAKPIDIDDLAVRLGAAERLVRAVRLAESVKIRLPAKALPVPD